MSHKHNIINEGDERDEGRGHDAWEGRRRWADVVEGLGVDRAGSLEGLIWDHDLKAALAMDRDSPPHRSS